MKRLLVMVFSVFAFCLYHFPSPTGDRIYADVYTTMNWSNLLNKQQNLSRIQRMDAPFQLFQTRNHWIYLMLDTTNGRIWQIHWGFETEERKSVFRGKIPINTVSLITKGERKPGRFTLYPTTNMWHYLLLDQETGNVWECQFSVDKPLYRFIQPLTATLDGTH